MDRRRFVNGLVATLAACSTESPSTAAAPVVTPGEPPTSSTEPAVLGIEPLGRSPWTTDDPFLFCAYHLDAYPKGDARMAPDAALDGRQIGRDFAGKDGWSMYHGRVVPGFPRHPHRGFETVTVTRTGFVDHADSMGATARYGQGDAQWMTAGDGIVHAEMFPLRSTAADNPLELFQIWLNLPAASKRVAPHFTMFWADTVPTHRFAGGAEIRTIAGALDGRQPPRPPPDSWAARADAHVAIWTIRLPAGTTVTLPAAVAGLSRSLYLHRGDRVTVDGRAIDGMQRIRLRSEVPATIAGGPGGAELLLLQGRPIGEPVARHGPFVMNTRDELAEAYEDHRRDGFGGWPWDDDAPVHPRTAERFAVHADGRRDVPA